MVRKRIRLAQNFLTSRTLVEKLVSLTSIGKNDTVFEIGPGSGIITKELSKKAAKVIAIEIDPDLSESLRAILTDKDNIEIVTNDFLDYQITVSKYKVFSNIPFNITSDIVRKLIYAQKPPIDAYLIVQKEAAMKFSGEPHETEFSVLVKPWFSLTTLWAFRRVDFFPPPAVDTVLLHISRLSQPLVSQENVSLYTRFVQHGFRAWKKDLKTAYKEIFTYTQWKCLARDNHFQLDAIPTQLSVDQWINLFNFFQQGVPAFKKSSLL